MSFLSNKVVQRLTTPLSPMELEGHELRTVVFVAVSFQMVFTGYRSIQNLQSSLNEEEGLGVISLTVLYAAWIFSGFLTPIALRLLTTKGVLMVSWLCHVLYTACTFYPSWELTLPASFLVGLLSAPLWTSQSLYITACGFSVAGNAEGSPYHLFSRLNGIFFAIFETSQITGNLISSAVLQSGVGEGDRSRVLAHQCGRDDCPMAHNATDFEEPPGRLVNTLLGVFVSFNVIGLLTTYFFVIPLPRSKWSVETSTKETVTSFFVTLRRTAIGLLVPLFIFQGMQQAMLFSEYTRSYISCPLGIHMVGFVMATHGVTTPLTTWVFSRLVKHTGRYVLFVLAGMVNLGLMVVMYLWVPDSDDQPFIFLVPVAWGISEGIWLTQSNSLIAVQFSKQKEPAFAIYHTCRSIGLALTFAYSRWLCAHVKIIISIVMVIKGLAMYTLFEHWVQLKEKHKRQNQNGEAVSQLALRTISGLPAMRMRSEQQPSSSSSSNEHSSQIDNEDGDDDDDDEEDEDFPVFGWNYPVPGEFYFSSGGVSPVREQTTPPSHLPSVASSCTTILSTLSEMARLSVSVEEDEFLDSLPPKTLQRLSQSLSETQEVYF